MSKKSIILIITVFVLAVVNAVNVFAFEGWNKVDGQYVYLNNEGKMLLNTWKESNGHLFYLGSDGYMVKHRYLEYSGDYYYLDDDGHKVYDKWQEIDETSAPGQPEVWGLHYFDETGITVKKHERLKTKLIGGKKYAFDENGLLVISSWMTSDGEVITDRDQIIRDGVYLTDHNGIVLRNGWYNFSEDVASFEIGDLESRFIGMEYGDMPSLWMYFDNNCKKVKASDNAAKNMKINGNAYSFDENGIMIEGFTRNLSGINTTQLSNPTINQNVKFYNKESGELVKKSWVYAAPAKDMDSDDYYDDTKSWFYINDTGISIKNKIKKIDGKTYVFDGVGRMKSNIVLTDAAGYCVASYKPEELSREDFVYGGQSKSKFYGTDQSDIRFFGTDDKADGTMKKGEQKIELEDGTFSFCFNNNGVALGNNNTLKRKSDVYYINGLKLQPYEDGIRYGVVKVKDDEYRVVNASGKIVTGKKKIVKDDYDNYMIIMRDKLVAYVLNKDDKIKPKWANSGTKATATVYIDDAGYYYYDNQTDDKGKKIGWGNPPTPVYISGINNPYPSTTEIADMPEEIKLNFK